MVFTVGAMTKVKKMMGARHFKTSAHQKVKEERFSHARKERDDATGAKNEPLLDANGKGASRSPKSDSLVSV